MKVFIYLDENKQIKEFLTLETTRRGTTAGGIYVIWKCPESLNSGDIEDITAEFEFTNLEGTEIQETRPEGITTTVEFTNSELIDTKFFKANYQYKAANGYCVRLCKAEDINLASDLITQQTLLCVVNYIVNDSNDPSIIIPLAVDTGELVRLAEITKTQYNYLLSRISAISPERLIKVYDDFPGSPSAFEEGQIIFVRSEEKFYVQDGGTWEYIDLTNYDKVLKKVDGIKKITTTVGETDFINGQLAYLTNNNEQKLLKWNAYTSSFDVLFDFTDMSADIAELQEEIQHIKDKSDVVDVVGTYADLQAYDTTDLGNNDLIKVLSDETHSNKKAYYRYSKSTDSFSFVGVETEITMDDVEAIVAEKASKVSVSSTGTATDEINYITIDGVEKKIAGSGGTGAVSSVNGKTGDVILDGNDIRVNGSASALLKDYLGQLREDTDGNSERIDDVDEKAETAMEVASGKKNAFTISTETLAPTTDAEAQALLKADGTPFEDLADFEDYIGDCEYGNPLFTSQDDMFYLYRTQITGRIRTYIITNNNVVYIVNEENFNEGDDIYVKEQLPILDRWLSVSATQVRAYVLDTKTDLSNVVDLTSAQTISGVKTFSDGIAIPSNTQLKLGAMTITGDYATNYMYFNLIGKKALLNGGLVPAGEYDLGLDNNTSWRNIFAHGTINLKGATYLAEIVNDANRLKLRYGNADRLNVGNAEISTTIPIQPINDNSVDLGASNKKWRNLYLSGKLSDGTNEIVVADIASKDYVDTKVATPVPSPASQANKVLRANASGTGLEYASISGGTQWYKHIIELKLGNSNMSKLWLLTTRSTQYTSFDEMKNDDTLTIHRFECGTASALTARIYGTVGINYKDTTSSELHILAFNSSTASADYYYYLRNLTDATSYTITAI